MKNFASLLQRGQDLVVTARQASSPHEARQSFLMADERLTDALGVCDSQQKRVVTLTALRQVALGLGDASRTEELETQIGITRRAAHRERVEIAERCGA